MEIRQLQPSSENAQSDAKRGKPTRRRFTGDAHVPINKRVRVPAICVPAIFHLKKERGLRSDGDIIHWLIHELRPELLPAPKPSNSPRSRPIRNSVNDSVPKPVCMEYLNDDKVASYLPVASGTATAKGKPVRATVVQASTVLFDTPATLDKAERLIAGAAAYGSQLVVFPEAFLGGYPQYLTFDSARDDLQKYYTSAIDVPGPEVDWLAKIAGKYKVHLVMGVVERAGCYLFSTVLFFDSLGQRLGQQRKLMPVASESAVWYSGQKSSLPVYETSIGKIGGLVCWDNKSPLLRTELYAKGVEIYCAPSADSREIWKSSMIHIAVEGGCFVLSASQLCRRDYPLSFGDSNSDKSLDVITSGGGSVIVSPSGTVLAGPNYQKECLISADLDLSEINRAKTEFGAIGNNLKPDHVGWCASELNPILLATDIKIEDPNDNELSG